MSEVWSVTALTVVMAALATGLTLGLSPAQMKAPLCRYQAMPHRCELVATIDGIDYINDSKATNLDALEKALLGETRPVVLIAGGKDKGFTFETLRPLVSEKARAVILIGVMADQIFTERRNRRQVAIMRESEAK